MRSAYVVLTTIALGALGNAALAQNTAPGNGVNANIGQRTAITVPQQEVQRLEGRAQERQADFFNDATLVRESTEVGAWSAVTVLDLNNIAHQSGFVDPVKDVFLFDQRAWLNHTWDERTSVYVRLRKLNYDINRSDGVTTFKPDTKNQLDLDILQLQFPIGNLQAEVGRLFLRVGHGLTFSDVLDGALLRYNSKTGVSIQVLAGTTLHRTDNLDQTIIGFDDGHDDRDFFGVEGHYTLENNQRVGAYFLDQEDHTLSASPDQVPFTFRYYSQYLGFTADGSFNKHTNYSAEFVHEFGRSAGQNNFIPGRADIDANAALVTVNHRFGDSSYEPMFIFDYAFGSGDPRRLSVTNSGFAGPNPTLGDKNFLYFGRFEGGLALQPRLSNLEEFRFGFSMKPLAEVLEFPSDLLVGGKFSIYRKDEASGAISDPLAILNDDDIGTGLDLYAAYKVVSDVDVLFEYGAFSPGDAYPIFSRDATHKFATTVVVAY